MELPAALNRRSIPRAYVDRLRRLGPVSWSSLIQRARATAIARRHSSNQLRISLLASTILLGILVADWLVWPGRDLDILYAVPVLVAALYLSPRRVALSGAIALAADAIGGVIARAPAEHWAVTVPSLALVLAFGIILAYQRGQIAAHAAESERARDDLQRFLGVVAHDLAAPITALGSYAEILQEPALDPATYARIGRGVAEVAARSGRFVDDLRDAARIGRGSFTLHRAPADLVALSREVVEQQRRSWPRPEIVLEAPDAIPGAWDAGRFSQLLGNLLANAIRYSDGKPVRVTLELTASDVVGRVSDQGPGISPDESAGVFEPFVRLDRAVPGTGLGLYIAREIARAHGGRIWLDSHPGEGCTFSFALPRASHD